MQNLKEKPIKNDSKFGSKKAGRFLEHTCRVLTPVCSEGSKHLHPFIKSKINIFRFTLNLYSIFIKKFSCFNRKRNKISKQR